MATAKKKSASKKKPEKKEEDDLPFWLKFKKGGKSKSKKKGRK
jgi:hypothetical protein